MKTIKEARARAWEHEFDLVDDECAARRQARGRAHRAALHRSRGATVQSQVHPLSALGQARSTDLPEHMAAMPLISMSRHAAHRMKNRGISMEQVLVLTDFGVAQRSHGATRYALDKKARQLLVESVPARTLRRVGSLDIVAVFSDNGTLITASHRTERLRRDITWH